MINQEEIFQLIQNEDWDQLTEFLSKHKKDINTDPLLRHAAQTFISEFLNKTEAYIISKSNVASNLETLYTIHKSKYYILDDSQFKTLICRIVLWKKDDLIYAYNYAQLFPNEKICQEVIEEYEKLIPKKIEHTQSDLIKVSERTNKSNVDYRINLFKSPQEIEFFIALKEAFPTYQIYPNVAISCLLNWGIIKHDLSEEEKAYYFKAIVDFVVFDQAEGYMPIYFFELDSKHHDNTDVRIKDELKDSIFSKAGVRLLRIRKQNKKVGSNEFTKMIREIIKNA
jgi:hypothetical protein